MRRVWESLYSKNGFAAKQIAMELLSSERGKRIPRVSDFADKMLLGRGTVQGALRLLEELQAIKLESRGHLGTFLLSKDSDLLYEIAGIGPVIGVMPLPYSKKYEGLASGIAEALCTTNKKSGLAYMRGSRRRLDALKSRRYDFAVMSLTAAEEALKNCTGMEIYRTFGPNTYVTGHKIFFADGRPCSIRPGMRLGIDYTSSDQAEITLAECEGRKVEYVETDYMQLFSKLKAGNIDAAVWNVDESKTVNELNSAEFTSLRARQLAEKATISAMVVEEGRTDVKEQLDIIDFSMVTSRQKLVESGAIFPNY